MDRPMVLREEGALAGYWALIVG